MLHRHLSTVAKSVDPLGVLVILAKMWAQARELVHEVWHFIIVW